jgi:hypothetical protein
MPGTHVQKVRLTLPVVLPLALLPLALLLLPLLAEVVLLLQAARARTPAAAAVAASRNLRRNRGLRSALLFNDVIVLLPPKFL